MATPFEELRVLRTAETVADNIWRQVVRWDEFARDVVGKQLAKAADSMGANIAEAYGRFHFGEKIQFLYYSRGSLFETKYWLKRTLARDLTPNADVQNYANQLTDLARQLNVFVNNIKTQRHISSENPKVVRETNIKYAVNPPDDISEPLLTSTDLDWLQSISIEISL